MKYIKFNDIPQYTKEGAWECNYDMRNLVKFIDEEIEEQGLQLNPDFQRGHVWTESQQIAYLEFVLRGGKTGKVIYLNNPQWNTSDIVDGYTDYVCVDGLQRITAIQRFVRNEIKVYESYYDEYTDHLRLSKDIRLNINDMKTKKDVLQWYIEMNSGGTVHADDEIERVRKMLEELK